MALYGNTNVDGNSFMHQGDVNNQTVNHVYVGNVALNLPAELSHLKDVVTSSFSTRSATRQISQHGTVSSQNQHLRIEPLRTTKRRKRQLQPSQTRRDGQESKAVRSTTQEKMIVHRCSQGVSKLNSRILTFRQIDGPRVGLQRSRISVQDKNSF